MTAAGFEANDRALARPELRDELARGFDLVVVKPFLASEAGYHLAHVSGAGIVLFNVFQASDHMTDFALGQPNNPALQLFTMVHSTTPMPFSQRVINTVVTYGFWIFRSWCQPIFAFACTSNTVDFGLAGRLGSPKKSL